MEAPLKMRADEKEEEVMEMDLNTKRRMRSHHTHKLHTTTSPTSSESSETSESSNISFEDVLALQNSHTNGTTNGENSTIVEDESVVDEEAQVEAENKEDLDLVEEPNKEEEIQDEISMDSSSVSFTTHNQGTNGVSLHQNGHTIEFSLSESHAGSLEITSNSNSSSVSKSPDTVVGLKDLESLLDESSNNLNVAATGAYSALLDTLNSASKSVEGENGNLEVPKDAVPEVQEIGAELKTDEIQEHVLKLNNAATTTASVGSENGHLHLLRDPLAEEEEFDVERVVQKQETHDFYCPNCNSCITKRVILKRRKRKIQEILLPIEEIGRGTPAVSGGIIEENQENVAAIVEETNDGRISAITCLSCFSIFLPTENGWLRRIFGRKPEITAQPDAPLTEPLLPSGSIPEVVEEPVDPAGEGKTFPLWIVTCCQPSTERPVRPEPPVATKPAPEPEDSQPDTKLPLTTPGTGALEGKTELHLPVLDEGTPLSPEHQSSGKPDTDIVQQVEPATSTPQPSFVPGGEIQDESEQLTTTPAGDADKPLVVTTTKPTPDSTFALWFLNCCQPQDRPQVPLKPGVEESIPPSTPVISSDKDISLPIDAGFLAGADEASYPKAEPSPVEGNVSSFDPISNVKPGGASATGTSLPDTPIHVTIPDDGATQMPVINVTRPDVSVPSNIAPPETPDGGAPLDISSPHMPVHVTKPDDIVPPNLIPAPDDDEKLPPEVKPPTRSDDDITLVPEPKPAPIPLPGEEVIIPMVSNQPVVKPPPTTTNLGVILPGDGGASDDLENPLLGTLQGCDVTSEEELPTHEPRPGVEIIKAIVYGGLLECITSLSVITSAAGGDATTLNIVALGLANVFGGLILLFHNLRVLKHEHGTKRYIQQLGQPGHYWLHAIVAVISYLIFGLMAPIIYGFCYRKSDNKDNKLIVLASASLACIAMLSAAKAHVRTPPGPKNYMATVFYYIGVGFSVSGLGYVAGHFINILLKKLGVFDPAAAAAPKAGDLNGSLWASY